MKKDQKFIHPYIPNSVPEVRGKMLKEIGVSTIDELYSDIPEELRFRGEMNLPEACRSEFELKKHLHTILKKNQTCSDNISFLGAGCYQHYVPAVCNEVAGRSEFLTAYAGEPYEDHGRFQTLFEYQSLMAELLDLDVVNVPTYDWCQAASTGMRMACRITGRKEVLLADTVHPDRISAITCYCHPVVKVTLVKHDIQSGHVDLADLKSKLNGNIAGFYFENPSYLGSLEEQGEAVAKLVHRNGSLLVVGVDPISLGVVAPPSSFGADICVGDIQSLGLGMQFGGATGGFISTRDEEKFVMEYPSRLFGVCKTAVEGEWGFGDVAYNRTSFGVREEGKEFIGTAAALWGIKAASYLALMGPEGMTEIGENILLKTAYLKKRLNNIDGVAAAQYCSANFREFVVDFSATGKSVAEINKILWGKGIFGGKDISGLYPELKNSALYCITEIHGKAEVDHLINSLTEIIKG